MEWDTREVLAARAIVPHLPTLLGEPANDVRAELESLLRIWDRERELSVIHTIVRLLADFPATQEWMRDFLHLGEVASFSSGPEAERETATRAALLAEGGPPRAGPGAPGEPALPVLVVRTRHSDHTLHGGTSYRIGRDPASDIVVADSRVSWRHAVLRVDGGSWVLEDVGSTNGTFLGLQRVNRIEITADCVVRLASPQDGPLLRCMLETLAAPAPLAGQAAPTEPTVHSGQGWSATATSREAPAPLQSGRPSSTGEDTGAWAPPLAAGPAGPPDAYPEPAPAYPEPAQAYPEPAQAGPEPVHADREPPPAYGQAQPAYPAAPYPAAPAIPRGAPGAKHLSSPGLTRRAWSKLRDTVAGAREHRPRRKAAEAAQAEPAPDVGPNIGTSEQPASTAYGLLSCPETVTAEQEFELEVGLSALSSSGVAGAAMRLPPAEERSYTLSVQLLIFGFRLRSNESAQQAMSVSAATPYPAVTLHLTPDAPVEDRASRRVKAMYSVDGQPVGFAVRYVTVTRSMRPAPELTPTAGGENLSIPSAPTPADLTVAVDRKPGSDRELVWLFQSPHDIDLPAGIVVTDIGPFASLQAFARDLTNKLSGSEGRIGVFATLKGKGRRVAAAMPAEFWDLLQQVAELAAGPPAILFLTDQPYVPWELATLPRPLDPDPEMPPFLCAQARVGRWLQPDENAAAAGLGPVQPPPTRLRVGTMAVVSGVYGQQGWPRLVEAEAECAALERDYGAAKINATRDSVFACIFGAPAAEVLHFAVHGEWDPGGVQDGLILVDGVLSPDQVLSGRLPGRPLVFLNACQVGQGSEVLGDYAGMAAAFLRIGASAVVAPLWSIDDATAASIALSFYQETLANGATPAEVLRRVRTGFKPTTAAQSSTCLAYQFFGDPRLELIRVPVAPELP
jgi:hypothetical protein